jgi:RNA polymerase sigma factor (sigma-70 family)
MATQHISEVLQHLRRAVLLRDGASLTDGQLLERFLNIRDQSALAVLVRRHGPMVWGVCRRVLSNHQDAEDAFQATFVVLLRKAAAIVPREMVANWLYGVAHQTALKARATAARRHLRERQVSVMPEPASEPDVWNDLEPLLDRELSRLPEKYRAVLVLCDLEGRTRKEAARQLGCPEGTVASRLASALKLLARRLGQHGVVVVAGTLGTVLSQKTLAVPDGALAATVKAITCLAAGQLQQTALVSPTVAALSQGVIKNMLLTRLGRLTAMVLVLGTLALAGGHQHRAVAQTGQAEQRQVPGRPAAGDVPKADAIKSQLDVLQGTWTLVSREAKGEKTPQEDLQKWQLTIKGKRWTMRYPDGVMRATIRLDPTKNPRIMDLTFESPAGGILVRGIYQLEYNRDGDILTHCRQDDRRLPRPKEFKTTPKSGLLFLWKHAK